MEGSARFIYEDIARIGDNSMEIRILKEKIENPTFLFIRASSMEEGVGMVDNTGFVEVKF